MAANENQSNKAAQTEAPVRAKEPVTTKAFTPGFGSKKEQTGEKIKDIADKTGFIIVMFSVIMGFWTWNRIGDTSGVWIGILVMCFGMFSAYVVVKLLYSYGDILNNSIEQTNILKRMEAEKIAEKQRREQEEARRLQTEKFWDFQAAAETDDGMPPDDAASGGDNSAPLRGVIDPRTRGVAHFADRSRHGIICPICGRIQDSNRHKCYSCAAGFIFDNEVENLS